MARALFSPLARNDLLEIWAYIATQNQTVADKLVAQIIEVADLVATLPNIGRLRNELDGTPRSLAIESYILFYDVRKKGIRVIRVLHGSRDIPSNFFL